MEAARAFVEAIKTFIVLATMVVSAITTWILGVRMRRRIKNILGVQVTNEMELTSLKTWLSVESMEAKNLGGKLH